MNKHALRRCCGSFHAVEVSVGLIQVGETKWSSGSFFQALEVAAGFIQVEMKNEKGLAAASFMLLKFPPVLFQVEGCRLKRISLCRGVNLMYK